MDVSPSPEFALEAAEHLAASRGLDAARLSAAGIESYPTYAGGYVMLAKAYAALGRTDDVATMARDIAVRFPHIRVSFAEYEESETDPVIISISDSQDTVILHHDADDLVATEEVENAQHDSAEAPEEAPQPPSQVLRILESLSIDDETRIIRSSSVRLIPGLEFTTLRVEGLRSRGRRGIGVLPDPPAFRSFHRVRRPQRAADPAPVRKPVSLEELASRLSEAKIPRPSELDATPAPVQPTPVSQPIMVTDTIAQIYMQQESYDLAIEAFKTLMSRKPERKDHYEALIRECERKRG
jgi:tetratricopeptide (TPR) repeat protein